MSGERSEGSGGAPAGVTRRQLLEGTAAAALGVAVLGRPVAARAVPSRAATISGLAPVLAAMHVHASHSEGPASWQQQYANAAAAGVDVLWQTDHDFRARALRYMTLLAGTFVPTTTGAWAQRAATFSSTGPVRVLIESAGSAPAVESLVMEDRPTADDGFRTGIQGQTLTHVFGTSRLDAGARYELVLHLSLHPAQGGRPGGQFSLRYRFMRGASRARFTESRGLVGVVRAPMPPEGTTVTLDPESDIRALWPTMLAIDHCSWLLSFVCTSPRHGVVADVNLLSVTVDRPRHDADSVRTAQETFARYYSSRYPVLGIVSEEVSLVPGSIAHCNAFGVPPEWALKDDVTETNWQDYYRAMIGRVHAGGGVVSWNHPLGFGPGPQLPQAEADAHRREVFALRADDDFCDADLLEVGYLVRGFVPFAQHLALWDTFSRRARWLTGNGASDDHSGRDWRQLTNGFLTGIWAASTGEADLVTALAGGRAFTHHPRFCPGLDVDTVVDGTVPMGKASISSRTARRIEIAVSVLPADCTLELVRGPVDYAGEDPATEVVAGFPQSAFGGAGTGTVAATVDTDASCFVRPQVRRRNGMLVATGNPTWLLREPPPAGIPAGRTAT
jgi:hypothetical protein